jgi:hypothetical protein
MGRQYCTGLSDALAKSRWRGSLAILMEEPRMRSSGRQILDMNAKRGTSK